MFNVISQTNQEATFLQTAKKRYSYKWLKDKQAQITGLFSTLGLQPGDRLMLGLSDDAEMSALFITAMLNNITVVMADPEARGFRVESIVRRTTPACIIADAETLKLWALEEKWKTIAFRADAVPGTGLLGKFLKKKTDNVAATDYLSLLQQSVPVLPVAVARPEDTAYIIFTSGTTAESKGVAITRRNLETHLSTLVKVYGLTPESILLNTLFLSHADGCIQGPVLAAFTGCSWHKPFRFTIEKIPEYLDYIFANNITHVFAVPAMLNMLLQFSEGYEDSFRYPGFRALLSVSAHLDAGLWERFESVFTIRLSNVYGLTETVAGSLFCTPVFDTYRKGTAGKPVDCATRIVDENRNDVMPGETGELWLRGDHIMPAYWNDPEATKLALHDGWLMTGDLAAADGEGFISILGRKKNLIISGGFNIQPEEVTESLLKNADVMEATAFGLPDEVFGEKLAAAVVLKAGTMLSSAEIINECRTWLEERKIPGQIFILDELPKGVSGKVSLPALREKIKAIQEIRVPSKTGTSATDILSVAADAFQVPVSKLSMTDTSRTIAGWDSLAHLSFVTSLESHFNVRFNTAEVITMNSLRRAAELIEIKNG